MFCCLYGSIFVLVRVRVPPRTLRHYSTHSVYGTLRTHTSNVWILVLVRLCTASYSYEYLLLHCKSETYKETIKEKSTILPYSIHKRIHVRICCNTLNSELPLGSEGHDRAAKLQITLDPVARGSIPRCGGVFPGGYPGDLPEDSTVYIPVSSIKAHKGSRILQYRIPLDGPAAQPLGHRAEAL